MSYWRLFVFSFDVEVCARWAMGNSSVNHDRLRVFKDDSEPRSWQPIFKIRIPE